MAMKEIEREFLMAAGSDGEGQGTTGLGGNLATLKRLVLDGLVSVDAKDANGFVILALCFRLI